MGEIKNLLTERLKGHPEEWPAFHAEYVALCDEELSRLRSANEAHQEAWDDVVDAISKFQPDHKGSLMEMLSDLGEERDRLRNAHETLRDELGELRSKLAQAEADKARMEAKGQDLRDSLVKIRCADCAEHGYTAEKMDCPVCAEGMRRIWDWYAALSSPGTALEAVREVINRLEEGSHRATEDGDQLGEEWFDELAANLRTAFGLEVRP